MELIFVQMNCIIIVNANRDVEEIKMLEQNIDIETIIKVTGLNREEFEKLKD